MARAALVLAICALLPACGGDASSSAGNQDPGRQIFVHNCAACHTLSSAGTHGTKGVNFDYRKVSREDALFAIRNGGFGGKIMPANIVTGDDAEAVANFVAKNSGSKASGDLDSPDVARIKAAPTTGQIPQSDVVSEGFLRAAFNSAQSLWQQQYEAAGPTYRPARLIIFHNAVNTACGHQTAQTGPFYCPADHGVYLNTAFFAALGRTFGLNSPFAPGYVTAHEVAHHVQQLLGLHSRVAHADAVDPGGANGRSIRVELQADCYAGVWLHHIARAGQLSDADVADILRAAAVVGDDFQRNLAGAELAPETWTHGSSEQRVHWVTVGKRSGLPADCDTFAAG